MFLVVKCGLGGRISFCLWVVSDSVVEDGDLMLI